MHLADAHSTQRAIAAGAVERNPLMRRCAPEPACLWSVKAGVAAVGWVLQRKARSRVRLITSGSVAGMLGAVSYWNYRLAGLSHRGSWGRVAAWSGLAWTAGTLRTRVVPRPDGLTVSRTWMW